MAVRALVLDESRVAADRIAVNRVVDGEIAHICVVHGSDDLFESLDVLRRVTVHLDVGDVPRVLERMVRSLDADLVVGTDVVVDGHMT